MTEAEMIEKHTPLVHGCAHRLTHRLANGLEYADLIQAGLLGLLHAVRRFDEARGCEFSTYAVACIRGNQLQLLRSQRDTIRVPGGLCGPERMEVLDRVRVVRLPSKRRARNHAEPACLDRAPEQLEAAEEVQLMLKKIKSPLRRWIVEQHLAGRKDSEIALELGQTRSNVQQLRSLAMGQMRQGRTG